MIKQTQHQPTEDGFTLVELLVVVIILGVLASIVVFAVGSITDRGKDAGDKVDTRALEIAEEHAYARSLALSAPPLYVSESELVNESMLRTLSSMHDICLRSDQKDYFVDVASTDCSSVPPGHIGVFSPAP